MRSLMRTKETFGAIAVLACFALTPVSALAQKKPVQLSLVTPVQIFPPEDTIAGVRLNILYGRNVVVSGLDIGLVNHTTDISRGVQHGLVGIAGSFQGIQVHVVNISKGKFEGWQMGHVNVSDTFRGFQMGLVNTSGEAEGFQLSLVNYARRLTGLQIGLLNINKEGGMVPVFPLFTELAIGEPRCLPLPAVTSPPRRTRAASDAASRR